MITLRYHRGQRIAGGALGIAVLATSVVVTGCATSPSPVVTGPTAASILGTWELAAQVRPVEAPKAIAVSVHPLASEIGAVMMRRGGNAVDAAVAIGFALAVVHPSAGNLGGGGFMVARMADGGVYALDFRETAPRAASSDMYLDSAGNPTRQSLRGHLASGVPGSVAGLVTAHQRFGQLPLHEVIAPAIRLASDGFVLDRSRARSLQSAARRLREFGASRRQFLTPDGAGPPEGTLLVQADLAHTLQTIAERGAEGFYSGWVADSIVAEMQRGAGLITHEDLASYRAVWREPVEVTYRGHRVFTMPAPSSGVALAEILNMVEQVEPLPPFWSSERAHLWAEVFRRAFTDRNQLFGDPAFVDVPTARLMTKEYAATRFAEISPDRATPSSSITPGAPESEETTHYSVVDDAGNAVAVTTTINGGYGSGVTVSGAGFLLNNEMDDFVTAPGRPNLYGLVQGTANAIEPGKRMLSSMIPTIVLDPSGELLMTVGSPGGPTIITTVAQVITNVVDYGMTLAEAVAAPRLHHQGLPDKLRYERGGLLPSVEARLRAMGHEVEQRSGYSGQVAGIMRTVSGWIGVADPRSSGGAAGY